MYKKNLIFSVLTLWLLASLILPSWGQAQVTLNRQLLNAGAEGEDDDQFGEVLAVGDFNGDGFEDLAVGSPKEDFVSTVDAGLVMVYFGTAIGLPATANQNFFQLNVSDPTCGGSETGDEFGSSMAAGDFNDDGYDDLVVGAYHESIESPAVSEAGMITVFMGSSAGLNISGGTCLYQLEGFLLPGTAGANDNLGKALAVGNFNADAYEDLAIGAPFDNAGGSVTVVPGSAGGLNIAMAEVWTQSTAGMVDSEEAGDRFGAALATGNLFTAWDNDCDLVVGVPGEDTTRGAVHIIYGCSGGLNATGNQIWRLSDLASPETPEVLDSLGFAVAVGNFDDQDGQDVAASAPYRNITPNSNVGTIAVFYSAGAGGLSATNSEQIWGDAGNAPSANEKFGWSLAAENVEGQCDDLFVGVPGAESGGNPANHGQLTLYRGQVGEGLVPIDHETWDFGRLGLSAQITVDDFLGWSLVVGRFDGLTPSVAMGIPGQDDGADDDVGEVLILHSRFIFADGFESGDVSRWSASAL